jgi:putative SOS response-associated peptidase YedK
MCGRYLITTPVEAMQQLFLFNERLNIAPSYNVAPTRDMPIVRCANAGDDRELINARWGLIPFWAKDEKIGYKTINARSDTVASKPAFRDAYKKRRCLVPANGFYEWKKEGKDKQPFLVRLKGGELFAFAGLWSWWRSPAGDEITSYTIITTEPNRLCAEIHNRMPVILSLKHHTQWLDPKADSADLLKPYPAAEMEAFPVSKRVGNARNNDASLIEPISDS